MLFGVNLEQLQQILKDGAIGARNLQGLSKQVNVMPLMASLKAPHLKAVTPSLAEQRSDVF
ncbi:hypothetical protein [Halobacillus rhizosphaerae]|uniref:hypothetical protein n=1 Tax=Halobacillus rhizosphaerae TaxID=3064889 RepID=UPI00398A60A5